MCLSKKEMSNSSEFEYFVDGATSFNHFSALVYEIGNYKLADAHIQYCWFNQVAALRSFEIRLKVSLPKGNHCLVLIKCDFFNGLRIRLNNFIWLQNKEKFQNPMQQKLNTNGSQYK